MPLKKLVKELFTGSPDHRMLYHYTSLSALQGILSSRSLHVSDVRFLNDAAELGQAADRLLPSFVQSVTGESELSSKTALIAALSHGGLHRLLGWIKPRLREAGGIYVGAFTENGNLLSQWRGYCPPSRGVSIGFGSDVLRQAADGQGFLLGRCIYDSRRQDEIMVAVMDVLKGILPTDLKREQYAEIFVPIEADVLRIASLLKSPAFAEEKEWRIVSPYHASYVKPPVKYREGRSMLIPYLEFLLPSGPDRTLEIEHVIVGPTTHVELSITSLSNCLAKAGASPRNGVWNSQVPLRDS